MIDSVGLLKASASLPEGAGELLYSSLREVNDCLKGRRISAVEFAGHNTITILLDDGLSVSLTPSGIEGDDLQIQVDGIERSSQGNPFAVMDKSDIRSLVCEHAEVNGALSGVLFLAEACGVKLSDRQRAMAEGIAKGVARGGEPTVIRLAEAFGRASELEEFARAVERVMASPPTSLMTRRLMNEVILETLAGKIKGQEYQISTLQESLRIAQQLSIQNVLGQLRLREILFIFTGNDSEHLFLELVEKYGGDVARGILRHLVILDRARTTAETREAIRSLGSC